MPFVRTDACLCAVCMGLIFLFANVSAQQPAEVRILEATTLKSSKGQLHVPAGTTVTLQEVNPDTLEVSLGEMTATIPAGQTDYAERVARMKKAGYEAQRDQLVREAHAAGVEIWNAEQTSEQLSINYPENPTRESVDAYLDQVYAEMGGRWSHASNSRIFKFHSRSDYYRLYRYTVRVSPEYVDLLLHRAAAKKPVPYEALDLLISNKNRNTLEELLRYEIIYLAHHDHFSRRNTRSFSAPALLDLYLSHGLHLYSKYSLKELISKVRPTAKYEKQYLQQTLARFRKPFTTSKLVYSPSHSKVEAWATEDSDVLISRMNALQDPINYFIKVDADNTKFGPEYTQFLAGYYAIDDRIKGFPLKTITPSWRRITGTPLIPEP